MMIINSATFSAYQGALAIIYAYKGVLSMILHTVDTLTMIVELDRNLKREQLSIFWKGYSLNTVMMK